MDMKKEIIKKIIDYIEDNLEQDLNLDSIAAQSGYSKFHLNRLFTAETGLTIHKYLKERRLTAAARKLIETDHPITRIAHESGYESQQAFSLAFKRVYLMPPRLYRSTGTFVPKQEKIVMAQVPASRIIFNFTVRKEQEAA